MLEIRDSSLCNIQCLFEAVTQFLGPVLWVISALKFRNVDFSLSKVLFWQLVTVNWKQYIVKLNICHSAIVSWISTNNKAFPRMWFSFLPFFSSWLGNSLYQAENNDSSWYQALIRCDEWFGETDEKTCQPHEQPACCTPSYSCRPWDPNFEDFYMHWVY